jgi:hypothetical protein
MLVFWITAIPAILFTVGVDVVMKWRVSRRLSAQEQFSWWLRNSSRVQTKYEKFYPDSSLPSIRKCAFWLTYALGATLLITVFLK